MTTLADMLDEVMLLQTNWSGKNTGDMERRGQLIRKDIPDWLRARGSDFAAAMGISHDDLMVQGRDATGRKSEIPWVRLCSRASSPNATDGWYIVYLFAADGETCYLTLLCGATRWDGTEFSPRTDLELRDSVDWAHDRVEALIDAGRVSSGIRLGARRSALGPAYERATVCAIEYQFGKVPDERQMENDVRYMASLLGKIMALDHRTEVEADGSEVQIEAVGDGGDSTLEEEQRYFDTAQGHRERRRAALMTAHLDSGGSRKTMGQMLRSSGRQLGAMDGPDDPVAFGRFDHDGERFYIGRQLIYDDENEPVVINWKSPAAERFYQATHNAPLGVALKRQFFTQRNHIQDFEDTVFEDLARRVEALSGAESWGVDDAVLRELDTDHSGEMRSIVQTIHAAQYELIRRPIDRPLVIQGGPGTGKTAVALHRVSWLLYNHGSELGPSDVLVVGPNPTFSRYIKSVLPGLGDTDVPHADLKSLGPTASHGRQEDARTARVKGEARMAELLQRGLRQRVRVPDQMDTLTVGPTSRGPRFARRELEEQIGKRKSMAYNTGRSGMRTWLSQEAERRSARGIDVTTSQVESALDRLWPSLTPQTFLRELLGSRDRLLAAAGDDFSAAEVARLYRPSAERVSDEQWSDTDVALIDEAERLMADQPRTYRHVVVDEAQDLSPMQLRSVAQRSRSGSMTIVGDIAQSTGAWARDNWNDIISGLAVDTSADFEELTLGYRVPKQVYEFAAQLLPLAAPGTEPPVVVREGPAEPDLTEVEAAEVVEASVEAARQHAGSGRFVGIVCPDSLRSSLEEGLSNKEVQWADGDEGELNRTINVVRPANAKGLEFDAVVVVEPTSIVAEGPRGHRMLYIALTRTTRYLSVVYSTVAMPLNASDGQPAPEVKTVEQTDQPQFDFIRAEKQLAEPEPPQQQQDEGRRSVPGPTGSLETLVAQSVAPSLAAEIREHVGPNAYAAVLRRLAHELGVPWAGTDGDQG